MTMHRFVYRPQLSGLIALSFAAAATIAIGQTAPQPSSVAADETNLDSYVEQTTTMATKVPVENKEHAKSLTEMNAAAIGDRKVQNLEELQPYAVGMNRESTNSNGFNVRGFSNAGTFLQNLQTDGLQGSLTTKGSASTANTERVEVLKGPNSVLYGQMNPGGLINLVTKGPKMRTERSFTFRVSSYASDLSGLGKDLGLNGTLDMTGPIDQDRHWLYRLVVFGEDASSFRWGIDSQTFGLYPSMTYRWTNDTFLTLKAELFKNRRAADDGMIAPWNNLGYLPDYRTVYNEKTDWDRDFGESFSSTFQHRFDNGWAMRAQTRSVWHGDTRQALSTSGTLVSKYPVEDSTLRRRYQKQKNGHRWNVGDANVFGTVGPESFRNTLLFGMGGLIEFTDLWRVGYGPIVATPVTIFNPIRGLQPYPADGTGQQEPVQNIYSYGFYASDLMKIGDRTNVTLGIRRDQTNAHAYDAIRKRYYSQNVNAVVYQAGIVYKLTDLLSIYACTSQSFKPNNLTNVDATGRSGFPPEEGEQIEAGFKVQNADSSLFTTLAAYEIKKTNVLVGTGLNLPDGQGIMRVDGEQTSKGVEWEGSWMPIPNWQLQAGMAYNAATITKSNNLAIIDKDLANAPRASGSLWTRYNIATGSLKGLGAGVGTFYIGKRYGGSPDSNYFVQPGYTRVDLAFYYRWKSSNFTVNIGNVLDRKYIGHARTFQNIFPGEPRKISFTMRTEF
ncbi:MAG: TonB-dependent siderophore receptor [Opitutaceae bacterium]|nr:TonB-dependent siderophore receptor [Opitutaceae bacterium]